ncbi:HAMP domain-containing sensor histidine kinase [Nonomuraea sp. CA-218870]|uniref:sensor histidine kinase n=1 Tax=Nonomuraea sp. CA-218870 TaxID=3239998 RepID=UPI003D93304F
MRLWVRSLRGRVTIIATVVAALVLTPVAIAVVLVSRHIVAESTWEATGETADRISAQVRSGELGPGSTLPVLDPDVDLIQLVSDDGRILATSDAARSLPRLSDVRPPAGGEPVDVTDCLPAMCLYLSATRAGPGAGAPIVYAGQPTPALLADRSMEVNAAAQLAAILALTAWATWAVTGSALRPVARMRRELDDITARDVSKRVTQPPGDDEVAQLARSVNGTLARLERSGAQQRQFAADASHELRTPIAGLRTQLESARLYPDETEVPALVESALRDTDRLEAIITDLLLLARIGSDVDAARELVDLAGLVRQELAGRKDRIPVRTELAEGVVVNGVQLQLARLLANLLDNAQRHAESQVTVEVSREDGQAVLAVENDGAQIAVADRKRIFERFTRLDAARSRDAGGTGLGLAIARDVAEAHGGRIRVEDCPNGARFVLRLPEAPHE